jgi:alcohol dehydrogenase, propanol-preferring
MMMMMAGGTQGVDVDGKEWFVRQLGAEAFFNITSYRTNTYTIFYEANSKLAADVRAVTPDGQGAAAVLVCVDDNDAYSQAMGFLRFGGTLICVGLPGGDPVQIPGATPAELVFQEKKIVGSLMGDRRDAVQVLDMAARGLVKPCVSLEPMSNISDVFIRMRKKHIVGRVVLDMRKEH